MPLTSAQREHFLTACAEFGLSLTGAQMSAFDRLTELLVEWSAKFNLTAIRDVDAIIDKHYVDSLRGHSHIGADAYVLDIGTGAGFPGLPLKIVGPARKLLMIDGTGKKITYVRKVIAELGLQNISAEQHRAEEPQLRLSLEGRLDVVTARAVAASGVLAELAAPYLKKGGTLLLYKGLREAEEVAAKKTPGYAEPRVHRYRLPAGDERALLEMTKS